MIINVDTLKLSEKTLLALAEGTQESEVLKKLYSIEYPELHNIIAKNYYVDEELLRKMYGHYIEFETGKKSEDMIRKIFYNPKLPEDMVIEILQRYNEKYKDSFGYMDRAILYNECITEKTISLIYNMYKSKEISMDKTLFLDIIGDARTGVDVLNDILKSNPDNETLCIIARHPKMKIVPASEVKS